MARDRKPNNRAGSKSVPKEKRRVLEGGPKGEQPLPTRDEILTFVQQAQTKVGKREIARAFGIKGGNKIGLKKLLADMTEDGTLAGNRKALKEKGGLPPVSALEITGRDDDGDLIARPVIWDADDGARPAILLLPGKTRTVDDDGAAAEIGVGDRILARVTKLDEEDVDGYRFEAEPIRKLPRDARRLLGVFRTSPRGGGTIEPIDRKQLKSWTIQKGDEGAAKDGDLVRFDLVQKGRMHVAMARVLESLGNPNDQRKISLIAVHTHGIPDDFPHSVIAETANLPAPVLSGRDDLRHLPLLTIDPVDARDHDDAVYAEPDSDGNNRGGFVVIVAIADVAHYIRPGSRLDREALLRGNSVYFPDRVVPMLPEKISNDLCSLREGEDRPCLAARMVFDKSGEKRSHTILRGMMRSAAKLSYQEAQAAIDGNPNAKCLALMDVALRPLWAAYAALLAARNRRGPLDLDLPERKIKLDAEGRVAEVITPERLDAHKLIEEMMIQANVAAAETLEAKKSPVVYRIHGAPSPEKLKNLRDFLETLNLQVPPAGQLKPSHFNRILEDAKSLPVPELVNEVVLRAQAQAEYAPDNIGHFGLHLSKYAHFTSPIRRYADLLVHRALVRAMKLGDDGLTDEEAGRLTAVSQQISQAERRAMAAERETTDRLIAAHLADRVGAKFEARIGGVTRSGLFVRLKDTGADGFVPVSSLGNDFYQHVEAARALVGSRTGETYSLGDKVEVKLVEAIPSAGALRFEMLTPGKKGGVSMSTSSRGRNQPRDRRNPGRPRR